MSKAITIYFFLLFFSLPLVSYSQHPNLQLLCSPRPDSILLRWAPADPKTWKLGNEYGYTILRYTILKDKKIPREITSVILTPQPLKPHPLNEWEPFSDDKYVAVAGECIFNDEYKGVSTGGNPFIAVKKYKNEMHRFSFALFAADQSLKAASLSGLYFADKTAQPDEKYLYKVFIPATDTVVGIDTASVFTGISEYQPLPKPLDVSADWSDKKVTLSWNFKYLKHIYNSYIVEKSVDGGKTYKSLNESTIVQLADEGVSPELIFKADTLANNETKYYYRVIGVSAFGEYGPPSDSIFGHGTKPLEKAPVITGNEVIDNQKIKLSWDYPEEMNPYISGFRIYSSSKPKGRKKKIYESLSAVERSFTDTAPGMTNYYMISVFNASKEKVSAMVTYSQLVDSFPPAPPKNVSGRVDGMGKVSIRWRQNADDDLEGYRVYMSNSPNFEFILVTPAVVKDTFFTDTINIKTLNRNIYYKVKAVDVRQNQSQFSELLTLRRPDVIPPVAPVIKSLEEQNGNISVSWVNSSSIDVAFHHLYRKERKDTIFQEIARLNKVPEIRSAYSDTKVKPGIEYTYYVTAEDSSGLLSSPSKTQAYKMQGRNENPVLKKRELTDKVKLFWNNKSEKVIVKVIVYRSVNGGPLQLYDNSSADTYVDSKLSPEKSYEYRVKAIYDDGSSSELSNMVKVKM